MIAGTFNEWFTLAHKVRTSDGQGGFTLSYVTYATEHGRMSRLGRATSRGSEPNIGEQLEEWQMHVFYCRAGVALERGDQITDSSGIVYLVLGLRRPSMKPVRHMEAECREVQQGQ